MGAKVLFRHTTMTRAIDAYSEATGVPRNAVRVDVHREGFTVYAAETANDTDNPFEIEAARLRSQGTQEQAS